MNRKISPFLPVLFALILLAATPAVAQRPGDAGRLQFRGSAFPVDEEAGEVTIVVKRQNGRDGAISVEYATTAGSATAGEDYEEVSGTLEWGDGDRSDKSFTVPILDDDDDEGQETFGIALSDPTGGARLGSPSSAVVRIKPSDRSDDDDDSDSGDEGEEEGEDDGEDAAGIIKLTQVTFPAFESSGEATFVIERDEGSDGQVSVDYSTIDGSAVNPGDYLTAQGTLTWADGQSGEKVVTLPVVDDSEMEDLETISVVLTNATGGASLGVRDVASIVIVDDDAGEGLCVPDGQTLCLRGGRFQITGTWEDFDGNQGPFNVTPASDETGLIWFFNESNIELLIKVLRGCPLNGNYWVFFAAVSNLGFTLEVTDLEAGATRTYVNPVGVIPLATTDVTAFATCP